MSEQKSCSKPPASSGLHKSPYKSYAATSISPRQGTEQHTNSHELPQSGPVDNTHSSFTGSNGTGAACDTSHQYNVSSDIHRTASEESPLKLQNIQSESSKDTLHQPFIETHDRSSNKDSKRAADASTHNIKSSHHSSDLLGSSNSIFHRFSSSSSLSWDGLCNRTYNGNPQSIFSSSSDEGEEDDMFIPEPIIQLSSQHKKPPMPYHTIDQLSLGKNVWVVDEEDVEMFIPSTWCNAYRLVCNGRLSGTVVRHNGNMTVVRFHDEASEMSLSLTLPRPCLSIKPIDPYENPQIVKEGMLGSCCCNTAARMAYYDLESQENSDSKMHRQFYESLSVLDVPAERLGDLGEAQRHFQEENLVTALELVNKQLSSRRSDMPLDVDALTLRSRIYVFLGRHEDALADAVCCAEMEPRWVRGYLSMARAHSSLGNFNEAAAALRKASALLPNSAELERIKDLNSYMIRVQKLMHEISNGNVQLILDYMYCKRIIIHSQSVAPNQSLCCESTPILAMPSIFGNQFVGRCEVCFREGGEEMDAASVNTFTSVQTNYTSSPASEMRLENDIAAVKCGDSTEAPLPAPLKSPSLFCSEYCQKRSTLFSRLEERHREGLQRVRELITAKARSMKDLNSLEMMNMTTRLFFMVVSTHRRLIYYQQNRCKHKSAGADNSNSQKSKAIPKPQDISKVSPIFLDTLADKTHAGIDNLVSNAGADLDVESRGMMRGPTNKALPIELALMLLGVYPLVSDYLSSSQRTELVMLYKVLTAKFKEENKKIYTDVLFCSLYNYIKAYFTPTYVPPSSTRVSPTGLSVPVKAGENTVLPFCISNIYYVFYLPLLVGCAGREVGLGLGLRRTAAAAEGAAATAPKLPARAPVKRPALPRRSAEVGVKANAKVCFVDLRSAMQHSPWRVVRGGATQDGLVALASSPTNGDEAGAALSTWKPPFPLLEVTALKSIFSREPLTYASAPHIGDIH